jgi:hypothetical protein
MPIKNRNKIFEKFLLKSRQTHGDRYDYNKVIYKNNRTPVTISCKIHGDFNQIPFAHHTQGSGCPKCQKTFPLNKCEFIDRSHKMHENKYDYSKVEYKNNYTRVKIICKQHGEFEQLPFSHLAGQQCRKCYNDSQGGNWKQVLTEFNKTHGEKYDYSKSEYIRRTKKITIICKKHGQFTQMPNRHINGQGCPSCVVNKPVSMLEIEFLNHLKIPIENRQYTIPKTRYQVDGICLESKTVYEFLGDYWHGNPEIHPKELKIRGRINENCGDAYNKTFNRFSEIVSRGYTVKYIWENDWKEWSKNKIGDIPIQEYP